MQNLPFIPIKGTENDIISLPPQEGRVYFATDTGRIFLDTSNTLNDRKTMGGAGISVYFADEHQPIQQGLSKIYRLNISNIDTTVPLLVNDLIINSDGRFFKIKEIDVGTITCELIAVSGTGGGSGGGGSGTYKDGVNIELVSSLTNGAVFINGSNADITFIPKINKSDETQALIDDQVTITWQAESYTSEVISGTVATNIRSNKTITFDMWTILDQIPDIKTVIFNMTSWENGSTDLTKQSIRRMDLKIELGTEGFNLSQPWTKKTLTIPYIISQPSQTEYLYCLLDDELILFNDKGEPTPRTITTGSSTSSEVNYEVSEIVNGLHSLELYLKVGEIESEHIYAQFIWIDETNSDLREPILWFAPDNKKIISEFETAIIKFGIYIPNHPELFSIKRKINGIEVRPGEYTWQNTQYYTWNVTEFNAGVKNTYTLSYTDIETQKVYEITDSIMIIHDDNYDLSLVDNVLVNFTPIGRDNSESLATRSSWETKTSDGNFIAEFKNFNWKYNGWMLDDKNEPILRLTNGASLTISALTSDGNPINYFYNSPVSGEVGYFSGATFEFRFKVSNVKNYKKLIEQITYQKLIGPYGPNGDDKVREDDPSYDSLSDYFKYTQQEYNDLLVVKEIHASEEDGFVHYASGADSNIVGLLLGAEEAFLTDGDVTTNVKYQKDEIISLAFVIGTVNDEASNQRTLKVYLNGVLSGIEKIGSSSDGGQKAFQIGTNKIKFLSNICDLDLYSFRIYKKALNVNEIMKNYISDVKDLKAYNQNKIFVSSNTMNITDENPVINYKNTINYTELERYNSNALDEDVSMCYGILTVTGHGKVNSENFVEDGKENKTRIRNELLKTENQNKTILQSGRLPVFKGDTTICNFKFYNPSLDRAIKNQTLTFEQSKQYFPSFTASGVELDVQGTSSQGYPRRNFKAKFKNAKCFYLNPIDPEGNYPISGNKFYLDSDNSTNKFTWKVDYMDSSSAHNTGLANYLPKLYNKHPLDDYIPGSSNLKNKYRTSIYGFPMMLFQEHVDTENKKEYEFIGKYNFNLDKGSHTYFGFEDAAFKNVAECWEVKNNQGSWSSFCIKDETLNTVSDSHRLLKIIDFFEYRYKPGKSGYTYDTGEIDEKTGQPIFENAKWEDYLDWIYNYVDTEHPKLKLDNPTQFNSDMDNNGQGAANLKLSEAHKNLYKLIEWLNSTDPEQATGEEQDVTLEIQKPYMHFIFNYTGDEEDKNDSLRELYNDDSVIFYEVRKNNDNTYDETIIKKEFFENNMISVVDDEVIYNESAFKEWAEAKDTTSEYIHYMAYNENRNQNPVEYKQRVNAQFPQDNADYRRAKFNAEFNKHLDEEYCLVYYVLTELLLLYDSRGKNMMLASWGPQEEGGEYIWYPIFYDLDTQLGLNNSGVPTYDYDTDASKDKKFSTADSVLWKNLEAAFRPKILSKYLELRDTLLTPSGLEESFEYSPNTYDDSYVMKGVRPLCVHNADEYFKYLAPMEAGYWTTDGSRDHDSGNYLYACQGTRQSYRKSLLKNRFNYIDSAWGGGSYNGSSSGNNFWFRMNLNNPISSGTNTGVYNLLQSTTKFDITTYLNQYMRVGYDKLYTTPINTYSNEPATIQNDTMESVITTSPYPYLADQLVYIPGDNFIKSLGDLSTKYISEWHFNTNPTKTTELQDFYLGNDNDSYRNPGLKGLILSTTDQTLPLLEKVNLSGTTNLTGGISAIGCPKLKEFKALRTTINSVTLKQPGSLIELMYLPNTINTLNFDSPTNLNYIIKNYNEIIESTEEHEPYQKKGLYIADLFDGNEEQKAKITSLTLNNDLFKYDSYLLFKQILTNLGFTPETNPYSGTTSKIFINLKNISWNKYVLENEETYNSDLDYYTPTLHHTYELVNNDKKESLLNKGLLYKISENYNSNTFPIENLDIFNICKKYSQTIISESKPTGVIPAIITGEIYIKNDISNPIFAQDLDKLEEYFENSHFYAENVKKGITVTYYYDEDSNEIYDSKNYQIQENSTSHNYYIEINKIAKEPKKEHYDFQYWYLDTGDPDNDKLIDFFDESNIHYYGSITSDDPEYIANIDDERTLKLKPYFKPQTYNFYFYLNNIDLITTTSSVFNTPIKTPSEIPYKKYEGPEEEGEILRYKFLGYSLTPTTKEYYENDEIQAYDSENIITDKTIYYSISQLNQEKAMNNQNYYAIFKIENLLAEDAIPEDNSCFYFSHESLVFDGQQIEGYTISIEKQLKGKILLPVKYEGLPIIRLDPPVDFRGNSDEDRSNRYNLLKDITDIYWKENPDKNEYLSLKGISMYAFSMPSKTISNLEYIQLESRYSNHKQIVSIIGNNSFQNLNSLINNDIFNVHALRSNSLQFAFATNSYTLEKTEIQEILGLEIYPDNYPQELTLNISKVKQLVLKNIQAINSSALESWPFIEFDNGIFDTSEEKNKILNYIIKDQGYKLILGTQNASCLITNLDNLNSLNKKCLYSVVYDANNEDFWNNYDTSFSVYYDELKKLEGEIIADTGG